MRRTALATTVLFLLVLTGCNAASNNASATATASLPAHVSTVHVVRTSDSGPAKLPAFDYTGTDATKAQALYSALVGLPAYVPHGSACPTDSGVQYQLTFAQANKTVVSIVADPSGCQIVVIGGRDNRTAAQSGTLWGLLAAAVGVPLPAVYPIPTH
jgi:hypothetical protein